MAKKYHFCVIFVLFLYYFCGKLLSGIGVHKTRHNNIQGEGRMETHEILAVIVAVAAIVGMAGALIAATWKLSGQISHIDTRIDSLEKHLNSRIDGLAADVRRINEHLRNRAQV